MSSNVVLILYFKDWISFIGLAPWLPLRTWLGKIFQQWWFSCRLIYRWIHQKLQKPYLEPSIVKPCSATKLCRAVFPNRFLVSAPLLGFETYRQHPLLQFTSKPDIKFNFGGTLILFQGTLWCCRTPVGNHWIRYCKLMVISDSRQIYFPFKIKR